jgi:hypothetical protein
MLDPDQNPIPEPLPECVPVPVPLGKPCGSGSTTLVMTTINNPCRRDARKGVRGIFIFFRTASTVVTSDADPNPDTDPSDLYVFWPPGSGSGSSSQRYGFGSGSFYHQAKIVRKTLIPPVL